MRRPDVGHPIVHMTLTHNSQDVHPFTIHVSNKDLDKFLLTLDPSEATYEILPTTATSTADGSPSLHVTYQMGGVGRWQ